MEIIHIAQSRLVLKADQTVSSPFTGSGHHHIFACPPRDGAWESGAVALQVLNTHEVVVLEDEDPEVVQSEEHWRTIEVYPVRNLPEFPDDPDGVALADSVEIVWGRLYRLRVQTAGIEASLWRVNERN